MMVIDWEAMAIIEKAFKEYSRIYLGTNEDLEWKQFLTCLRGVLNQQATKGK